MIKENIEEEPETRVNRTSIRKFTIQRYDKKNNEEDEKKSKSAVMKKFKNKVVRNSLKYKEKNYELKSINKLKAKYFDSKRHKKIKNIEIEVKKPAVSRENSVSKMGPKSHIEYLERSNSKINITQNYPSIPFKENEKNHSLANYKKYRHTVSDRNNYLNYPKKPRDSDDKKKFIENLNEKNSRKIEKKYLRLVTNGRQMFKTNTLKVKPVGDTSPVNSPKDTPVALKNVNVGSRPKVSQFTVHLPKNHSPVLMFDRHSINNLKI